MEPTKAEIIESMIANGTPFEKGIGEAWKHADEQDEAKIKAAWQNEIDAHAWIVVQQKDFAAKAQAI